MALHQFIVEYQQHWLDNFAKIASELKLILPNDCIIHHVGSTSITGMVAKDIIDIDIEFSSSTLDVIISKLEIIGYKHKGDLGILGREAFDCIDESICSSFHLHHLYVCPSDSPELKRHLAFRNYLRANPERAEWLKEMKIKCDHLASSRADYIERKAEYYAIINSEARFYIN